MALKHRSKLPRDPEAKKPLFQVVPDKCVLEPYQSIVVTLEGCSQRQVDNAMSGTVHVHCT